MESNFKLLFQLNYTISNTLCRSPFYYSFMLLFLLVISISLITEQNTDLMNLENINTFPKQLPVYFATYRANGHSEPHCVEDSRCDGTVMERVADAVIITEKAPLIRLYFCQV